MFKALSTIIISSAFLFSNLLYAHVNTLAKAELSIMANKQFSISIQVDLLHVLAANIKKSTPAPNNQVLNDKEIITLIDNMSMSELLKLLSNTTQYLTQKTFISSDNKLLVLSPLTGPTLNDVKKLISLPAGDQGYPVLYRGKGELSAQTGKITVQFPKLLGDTLLKITKPSHLLIAKGKKSPPIELGKSEIKTTLINERISTGFFYLYEGFFHIIPKGLDHILFVLALLLLTTKFSTLLWQVSAFTLAHTVTLALGVFGLVSVSSSIVEPLIALSIAYVAVENIYANKLKKWRMAIIFIFGLLHGLGFASVLLELGLSPGQYIISLVGFNLGVEIAQIIVLLVALICLYRFQHKSWYRQRIIQPFSAVIATVGLYWFIERL